MGPQMPPAQMPAAPVIYVEPAQGKPTGPDERTRYTRLGFILFWSGIMLTALMAILGAATESISWRLGHFIQNLAGLGGLVVLAGLGAMIYSRFFDPVKDIGASQSLAIPPAPPSVYYAGQQAAPLFDSREPRDAPSVTEHTTYALDQQRPGSTSRN